MPPEGKYNDWCHRKGLWCPDDATRNRAFSYGTRGDLPTRAQDTFMLHELAGVTGLEFVVFSNLEFRYNVRLGGGILLVPCFVSKDHDEQDQQLRRASIEMQERARFIYDGWAPIEDWSEQGVVARMVEIDEALTLFSLRVANRFGWEPKYRASTAPSSTYRLDESDLERFSEVAELIDALGPDDRTAVYRSVSWLAQASRVSDPAAKLLFYFLAVESLATYIEEEARADGLATLASEQLGREERRVKQELCIEETLAQRLTTNPREAIERAYLDCIQGIGRRLREHVARVTASRPQIHDALFAETASGERSLYQVRNFIAHGSANALDWTDLESLRRREYDAQKAATSYVMAVLRQALAFSPFTGQVTGSFALPLKDMVASARGMYQGPTHMAIVYS